MKELIHIAEKISRKKDLRKPGADRVTALFSCLELSEPAASFDLEGVRERIRRDRDQPQKLPRRVTPFRVSMAAAALVTLIVSVYFSVSIFRGAVPAGEVHLVRGEAFVENEKGRRSSADRGRAAPGEKIITRSDSAVDISFGENVRLRAGSGTELCVRSFENREGRSSLALFLSRGSIAVSVKKSTSGDNISVATAGSLIRVKGTLFTVSALPGGTSRITLVEGKIRVEPRLEDAPKEKAEELVQKAVVLKKGEFCTVPSPKNLRKSGVVTIAVAEVAKTRLPELIETESFLVSHSEKNDETAGFEKSIPGIKSPRFDRGPARYILALPGGKELLKVRERKILKTTAGHQVIWSRIINSDPSFMPLVRKNIFYLPRADGTLAALSSADGRILWHADLDGTSIVSARIDGDSLFVATAGGSYFRINQKGRIIWKNQSTEPCRGSTAVTGNLYFVSLKGGGLLGFDRTRGIKVFRRKFAGDPAHTAAYGNVIFLAFQPGKLIAFDYQSDEILWEVGLPHFSIMNSVATDRGIYLFFRKGTVLFVNNGGKILWKQETGGEIVAAPVLDDRHIHILGKEILLVLDKGSGSVIWTVVVPPVSGNNLILSGRKILFYTHEKGLRSLKK